MLSTSKNGAAVQFQFFSGWTPDATLKYVDEARAWADCATVAAALALIRDSADSYGFNLSTGDFA